MLEQLAAIAAERAIHRFDAELMAAKAFALLLRQTPKIVEADLNPVRCTTTGCVVLDLRLRIEHPRPVERVKTR